MTLTRKYLILVELSKKADYNAKITDIESKIPSITGSVNTTALNTVGNKRVCDLVKKNYDAKISEIEARYFTTSDCNNFMCEILDKKIKEKRVF